MTREDFKPLADFAREHYEPARSWEYDGLLNYIIWAADHDFLFIARDNDGSIIGAAIARPVSDFPEKDDDFDLKGDIIYVDVMVAVNTRAFQLLGFTILEHFNNCDAVAFQRLKRGDARKIYSVKHVRNTLFKVKQNG